MSHCLIYKPCFFVTIIDNNKRLVRFNSVTFVLNIIPVVVVIIVILISWLMTYGFLGGYTPGKGISDAWLKTFQIVLGIVFIGVIVWATGAYKLVIDKPWVNQIGETVLLVGAVIAVIAIVISSGGEKKP